jgi:hypothetical protein
MDRGPLALFGAIVAVGLGPALWLGAQFGQFDVAPPGRPVPVDRTHDTTQLMGGTAAGDTETGEDTTPVGATPRTHVRPARTTHSAKPSTSPTATTPPTSPAPDSPSPSTSPSASSTPSDDSTSPDPGDDSQPPSPPPSSPTGKDTGDGDDTGAGNGAVAGNGTGAGSGADMGTA